MSGPTYCIDSDIIIWHLRNGARKAPVTAHLVKLVGAGALACSTISIAEVEQGVRRGEEDRTRAFLRSLDARGVDRAVAERAGEIVGDLRSRGITMGLADALIAATCLVHDLTLVTLNVADFEKVPELVLEQVPA